MKLRYFTTLCAVLLAHVAAFAGYGSHSTCAARKTASYNNHAKTTLADAAEDYYDINYLKFNLNFTDTSVYVSGDVATYATVLTASMDKYVFELDSLITIDSIIFNSQLVTSTALGFTRTVTLATPLLQGDQFIAHVYYRGAPSTGGGFFTGVTHDVSAQGTNIVYTLSDPYAAKDWWPCKQSIDDKIDTVDMRVTVRDGLNVGSNGVLKSITPQAGFNTYHWQTKYPIDYYLISVAVAPYTAYSSYLHFAGSTDSMLVQNFFYDTATFNPAYKANFDSIGLMIDYISTLYGRYPFWKEKYGVCYSTLGGGMEHQTMTTIGVPDVVTIAHELGHQWFGDNVTYATWGDVWLSEGFATYTEQLFLNHFHSAAAAKAHRQTQYTNAMGSPAGRVYVDDTTGPNTLFDQRLVYNKAAAVVHMLRFMAPADTMFFDVLKTYQQQYALGLAGTADLKNIAEQAYGRNLDTFFNQWIYGQGYPKYSITWNQDGSNVTVKLVQITSDPSSVPLFITPLQLQLQAATGDTIVTVYNNAATQVFTFNWAQQMSTVKLEPNLWILCKQSGAILQDTTLQVSNTTIGHLSVFPNPTTGNWQVEQLPEHSTLTLTDMDGRSLWKNKSAGNTATIPGTTLSPGSYLLQIATGKDTTTIKLVKK